MKHLFVLLASLFAVSIGFGITLLVLAFYAERLAMAAGASHKIMAVHVGLLTGVFSLMQLSFAPLAGRLSDRMGFGIALLLLVRTGPQVFGAIGLLALGMAFISPKRLYRNALTPAPPPKAGDGSQSFCSDSPLPSVGEGPGVRASSMLSIQSLTLQP